MIAGKTLLDYTNSFSPNDYQRNDKIVSEYFKYKYSKRKFKPWIYIKKKDETRIYLLKEIKHNNLASKKHKKIWRDLNYVKHILIFLSAVSACVSISAFASLVDIPVCVLSSAVGLKFVH